MTYSPQLRAGTNAEEKEAEEVAVHGGEMV
jgi:hypothetical protein